MDQPIPPATISPGAIDNSLDPSSAYDETSSFEDATYAAYYMLRFPDGQYLQREPILVVGRDSSLKQIIDQRESLRAEDTPGRARNHESDYAQSVTSDDSGEHGSEDEENPGGVRFKYSHCGGFRTSLPGEPLRGDKGDETYLPIHPPVQTETGVMEHLGSISKRHARIKVEEGGIFLEVLGRNGLFLDKDHLRMGVRRQLHDGHTISIAGLEFGVCLDPSKANIDFGIGENMDPMDLDAESEAELVDDADGARSSFGSDASNEGDDQAKATSPEDPSDDRAAQKSAKTKPAKTYSITAMHKKQENETEEELRARLQSILPPGEKIEKRKGPGRPPANGLMSKRQLAEVMKAKKLRDEAAANGGVSPSSKPITLGDADEDAAAKARNKKRKRSDSATEGRPADGERKKAEEPARSPSPLESEFTAKQLEKPDLTYALMIYKILDERKPAQLNLQQLYKEVKNRWPYYRFKKDTTGWESSVRHTIKQQYFKQGERDGKGYRYTVNTDVDPPTQKSKPAPTPSQPAPYGNAQYNRGPYQPYSSHPGAGSFRPPYPNQPTYQYQMQAQRPINGTQLQYAAQYNPQAQANAAARPSPSSSNTAQQPSNAAAAPQFANPHAPMSAQQYRPGTSLPANGSNGVAQAPSKPVSGNAPAQLPLGMQNPNAQPRSAQSPQVPQSRSAYQPSPAGPSHQGVLKNNNVATPANAQVSRPNSTTPAPTGTPNSAMPIDRPLPSEEIRSGKVPQVLTDFINNMKKMCKDLPPSTVNESVMRAEDAIEWVMKNQNGDPASEPGKSHLWRHLVGLVQETISVHDRQERARRGESSAQPAQATYVGQTGSTTTTTTAAADVATQSAPAPAAPSQAPAQGKAPAQLPAQTPTSSAGASDPGRQPAQLPLNNTSSTSKVAVTSKGTAESAAPVAQATAPATVKVEGPPPAPAPATQDAQAPAKGEATTLVQGPSDSAGAS